MRNCRSFLPPRASVTQQALALALGVGLLAACGSSDQSQEDAPLLAPSEEGADPSVPPAEPVVSSRDELGAPTFLWAVRRSGASAVGGTPEEAARAHLVRHASTLGISEGLARAARVASQHDLAGGGSVLSFTQQVDGIEVFRTRASIIVDATNNLVAISGNLRSVAGSPSKRSRFTLTPQQALARAYADRFGVPLAEEAIVDEGAEADGEYRSYRVNAAAGAPRILDTARLRKVYVAAKGRLVAAYHAEFLAQAPGSVANDGWLYAIAADDGRLLVRTALTAHESFTYRVWAETGQHGIPTDGPLADTTPLSGPPSGVEAAFVAPRLVTVDGFNKNPAGSFDPWLPRSATETSGNNVDAYSDRNSKEDGTGDGFDPGIDIRADITAARTFDRTYNFALQPNSSADQMKAAITQLFYVNNWLHDYWYDSGFDEKSGNAQQNNYGRGGKGGDPLHAEAQDGADVGRSNNANMTAFSDGKSPRMQMFVWNGRANSSVTAAPPIAFANRTGVSGFGPQTFTVSGTAATATPADACAVPASMAGKIAIVDRGTCDFAKKAANAQAAGAKAVLLVNNAPGGVAVTPGGEGPSITIPVLGLSLEDGAKLKARLSAGSVTLTLRRGAETLRDASLDNGIIAHEWGHYLHHRLVQCGGTSCGGMSEGWADFNALMMVIKEGDALDGTAFPLTQYAAVGANEQSSYFGIRRAPYSSDPAKNPFTFKHIRKSSTLPGGAPLAPVAPDMSEVHNVGEVWAQALFEAYTNLLRDAKGPQARFSFDQAKRRMADYVVAGMKAAPPEPTFTEQRDALLAVAFARDARDFAALSRGFAKRGLGVGAIAPPAASADLDEAVEGTSFKGSLAFVDSTIDDAVRSCDNDGFLDANEKGNVTIRVKNAGWATLTNTAVRVTSSAAGLSFANDGRGTVVSIDPFGIATLRVGVSLAAGVVQQVTAPITVTLTNPASFSATVTGSMEPRLNFDSVPSSATVDDVESPQPAWTPGHDSEKPLATWSRNALTNAAGEAVSPPNFHWHGADAPTRSDESLVSPTLLVSPTGRFKISFKHRYSFENGPEGEGKPVVYFDGGVIEISTNDGATWSDLATLVDLGYPRTIFVAPKATPPSPAEENPLSGRRAFAGELKAWTPVTIDLGTRVAGKRVKIRFRIGTDAGSGAPGWDIDDLAFTGLTNKPFPTLVKDAAACP